MRKVGMELLLACSVWVRERERLRVVEELACPG
jgi:hypothetical protein